MNEHELVQWINDEQANLWSDLIEAIRSAANGSWSMRCANVARRIIESARLVGPIPHGQVPISLVAGGVYEAVLRAGGFTPDLPDEAEWQHIDELQQRVTRGYYQRRDEAIREYAGTRASIADDRERAFIAGAE